MIHYSPGNSMSATSPSISECSTANCEASTARATSRAPSHSPIHPLGALGLIRPCSSCICSIYGHRRSGRGRRGLKRTPRYARQVTTLGPNPTSRIIGQAYLT